jgi:hypothetical protein
LRKRDENLQKNLLKSSSVPVTKKVLGGTRTIYTIKDLANFSDLLFENKTGSFLNGTKFNAKFENGTKGGFHKAIYALCLKSTLCTHPFCTNLL